MKYKNYKNAIDKLNGIDELRRLLKIMEEDKGISSREYEGLRYLILKKIYK